MDDWLKDVDVRVQFGIEFGKTRGFLKTGDPIGIVTGWKQGSGFTNTMRIMYVFENDCLDKYSPYLVKLAREKAIKAKAHEKFH